LFKVLRGGEAYAVTQFQPIAARQVFPGFDEPVFKVPFSIVVESPAQNVVVTNTPEISSTVSADGFVRHVFEITRPLPTYLLAFAVGPYDVVDFGLIPTNSIRDQAIPLRGIAARGLAGRMDYALENTGNLLFELEKYFGTPYPYKKLDLIAMPESFGGAMENAGAITYDEYLLLMDEHSPLEQRRAFITTHAHELAHMWFGDLVTPSWWTDIWLNESFATWLSYKVAHAHWPEGEFDRQTLKGALGAMSNDSLAAARKVHESISDSNKISDAFDGITYQKGAGVLAMLERYAGEEKFQAGIRLHMDRYADSTVNAEGFMKSLVDGSGLSEIEPAFHSFINQAGVPLISVQLDCRKDLHPQLIVRQSRYVPLGSNIDPDRGIWHIPMCIKSVHEGVVSSNCSLLGNRDAVVNIDSRGCPDYVHPNVDGAGYYRFTMDKVGWTSLIDNSGDLTAGEALVFADSLDAGFRAGNVSAVTYIYGLASLVNHESWDVVDAVTNYFEATTRIIESSKLGPVEKAFREILIPRFESLGATGDTGSRLLHQRLMRFLIIVAKEPTLREPLAVKAAAAIGLSSPADPAAAPVDQLETIFTIGVQDIGEPFFDLLLSQAVVSEDPAFRNSALGALARVEEPLLVKKLQAAVIDKKFKGTEIVSIVYRQMMRAATTELTYDWLLRNKETIVAMIPETFRSGIVPALGNAFCSTDRALEWDGFIKSVAHELPGYERSLAQATESIRLCAALREETEDELIKAMKNYE